MSSKQLSLSAALSLFANRCDTWSHQSIVKDKNGREKLHYFRVKPGDTHYEPLSTSLYQRHLSGSLTLAVDAIDHVYCSDFCVFDCDDDSEDLDKVETTLTAILLHPHREGRRQGRAGHTWLFFQEPLPANELLAFASVVMHEAQVSQALEFFPKYPGRLSQIRLPLGVHRKPGAGGVRGWFDEAPPDVNAQVSFLGSLKPDSVGEIKRLAKYGIEKARLAEVRRPRLYRVPDYQGICSDTRTNLLKVIPTGEMRRVSRDWYATACPACVELGHDSTGDNLHINAHDGTFFKCWEGRVNAGRGHSQQDIVLAVRRWTGSLLAH
jgi:hypothetical protein